MPSESDQEAVPQPQVSPLNGAAGQDAAEGAGQAKAQPIPPEVFEKLMAVRTKAHEVFGRIVVSIMNVPRYRHLSVSDLQHVILEPLIHDRIMFAQPKAANGKPDENAAFGTAIWASVSEEVDAKIKEQIKAGVFPVRLQPNDWASGKINWLLDVITPNEAITEGVLGNFLVMKKDEERHVHPAIVRNLKPETLKKLGLTPVAASEQTAGRP